LRVVRSQALWETQRCATHALGISQASANLYSGSSVMVKHVYTDRSSDLVSA